MIAPSVLATSGLYKPERWCDTPSPTDVPHVGDKVALPMTLQYCSTKGDIAVRLV